MFNIKAHNTVRTYRIIGIPIVLLSSKYIKLNQGK
jgi:hypothetical protein